MDKGVGCLKIEQFCYTEVFIAPVKSFRLIRQNAGMYSSVLKINVARDIPRSINQQHLAHFPAQAPEKSKKFTPQKISYISGNGNFLV